MTLQLDQKLNFLKLWPQMLQMCVRAEGAMAKPPVATARLKVPNTADVNTREVSYVTVVTVVQPTPGSGWHSLSYGRPSYLIISTYGNVG